MGIACADISFHDLGNNAEDALDLALTIINDGKDISSLYRTSDMLGYGKNKIVRTITITDITIVSYPIE